MKLTPRLSSSSGQSIIEFAIVLPLILVVVLGVVEFGYALLDQHVVTKISREGSNLISRDSTIAEAAAAMKTMSTRPVDFDNGSRLIFSVIKMGATTGTTNFGKLILYQRYEYGTTPGSSAIKTRGGGAFGGAPDYEAANSDGNANLQVTSVPPDLVVVPGGMIYITEVFTRHDPITPLDRFGISLPKTLYSIAYF